MKCPRRNHNQTIQLYSPAGQFWQEQDENDIFHYVEKEVFCYVRMKRKIL